MNKFDRFLVKLLATLSMTGGMLGIAVAMLTIIYPDGLRIVAKIPGYANIQLITDDASWFYPYVKVVLYTISFFGAFELFYLKKRGFWLYTIAQVFLLIVPYVTWNKMPKLVFVMDLPDLYFTMAFIGAYALYYRHFTSATGTVK